MSRTFAVFVAVVALVGAPRALLSQSQIGPAPPRDAAAHAPTPGSGIIRGRVADAATGHPLARVDIRVIAPRSPQPFSTKTDPNGRYEVSGLPAGQYVVSASRTNYLTTSFGATRATGPGRALDVSNGQAVDGIDFALLHGGVIAGTVVDDFGEPAPDAIVTTLRYQYVNGERRLMPTVGRGMTNDIGEFRVFGLPPGDYLVAATARAPGFGNPTASTMYAPTFYPGTANSAEAQRVAVGAGKTIAGIALTLLAVQPARVSGLVTDSRGRPVSHGSVFLMPQVVGAPVGRGSASSTADGTFAITSVAPGDYILRASGGDNADEESAAVPVSVNDTDVSGIQLVTMPPSLLRGRIVFESDAPHPGPSALRIGVVRADPRLGTASPTVQGDLTFEIKASAGRSLLRVPTVGAWRLSRVLAAGVDVTDTGIDVPPNATIPDIVIEMTHHVAELSGRVLDANGQTERDCYVIVFSQDPTRWTAQSPRVEVSRPAGDGRFVVSVPAGDYFVAAIGDVEPGQWTDPDYLAGLRDRAVPVTLAADEKKAIDIKATTTSPGF